jgi:anti-anti-sigma regulatory factor
MAGVVWLNPRPPVGGTRVIEFGGEIDRHNAAESREQLLALAAAAAVVDLSEVRFSAQLR